MMVRTEDWRVADWKIGRLEEGKTGKDALMIERSKQ
jgi:hypothetical protein